jgi:hypothetical protein
MVNDSVEAYRSTFVITFPLFNQRTRHTPFVAAKFRLDRSNNEKIRLAEFKSTRKGNLGSDRA